MKIKTIGILTSGGDAPGMNAAIRAVTRAGICNGFSIKGIYRGYDGLIKGEVKPFTTEDVSGIITRGGTILKTARSKEFMTPEGKEKAYAVCQKEDPLRIQPAFQQISNTSTTAKIIKIHLRIPFPLRSSIIYLLFNCYILLAQNLALVFFEYKLMFYSCM